MAKYIDADELLKRLRELTVIHRLTKGELLTTAIKEVIEMPAADVEPVRKWILCSERLPERGKTVLVWYEYFRYGEYNRMYQTYGVGYQFNGSWSMSGADVKCFAWMPLPEPPKMDGGSE
ncbi:MAG: DUF551 domain-containing protein [Lachnospiraceae bacterium]|nr:DUF551 domain-containing protein [Lachnospiraceae bacterium]